MKQRGLGMVFQRGSTWWIQYHWRGQRYRETSSSTVRMDAVKILRKRLAEMGGGSSEVPTWIRPRLTTWPRSLSRSTRPMGGSHCTGCKRLSNPFG